MVEDVLKEGVRGSVEQASEFTGPVSRFKLFSGKEGFVFGDGLDQRVRRNRGTSVITSFTQGMINVEA